MKSTVKITTRRVMILRRGSEPSRIADACGGRCENQCACCGGKKVHSTGAKADARLLRVFAGRATAARIPLCGLHESCWFRTLRTIVRRVARFCRQAERIGRAPGRSSNCDETRVATSI